GRGADFHARRVTAEAHRRRARLGDGPARSPEPHAHQDPSLNDSAMVLRLAVSVATPTVPGLTGQYRTSPLVAEWASARWIETKTCFIADTCAGRRRWYGSCLIGPP